METFLECHPRVPSIGLTRQSRDPQRTLYYYNEAVQKRNEGCFHFMLKEYIRNVQSFRALRRLWYQSLFVALGEDEQIHDLSSLVMSYIPFRCYSLPRMYGESLHRLDYSSLSLPIRFQQMSGRLVLLGRPPLILPTITLEEVEYKLYEKLWRYNMFLPFPKELEVLYQELQKKGIRDKARIMLSRIRYHNFYTMKDWRKHCETNYADYFLEECMRLNPQAEPDLPLLTHWLSLLKYPSVYE